jgi:hypothetical protein
VSIVLASIGNLSSAAASAAAGNAAAVAEPITAASIYWPAWILVGGVLLALLGAVAILGSIKSTLLAKGKKRDEEFTRMLCRQVWQHTDTVTNTFAQRLRQPQRDVVTLRVLLRLLREDLAAPLNFVEQMRPHAPANWPDYDLFAAFNDWGGQVSAMGGQLAEMQQMLSYPAVREPVDAHRDAMLVHYYATEQVALGQTVSQLAAYAAAVCEQGKKVVKKETSHGFGFGRHDDHDDHGSGCLACGSASPHPVYAGSNARDLLPLPDPPKKEEKKKDEHKPAQQICYCVAPRPCHCAQAACTCLCPCTPSTHGTAASHH